MNVSYAHTSFQVIDVVRLTVNMLGYEEISGVSAKAGCMIIVYNSLT